jgi:uncharacterized protein YndB with AHSA1/START domain
MTDTIVVDYDLKAPPEKVWRTLTEPALLARWLMENDIVPVVGHTFSFRAPPMYGWDGRVSCEVLAVDPPRLLRYSWRGGAGPMALDTIVTWTLERSPAGGTRLHLEHAGFTATNGIAFGAMGDGWRKKGPDIDAAAEG